MGFFKFFRSNKDDDASAKLAKDRLQVLIAHQRTGREGPDYLPMLKQDILDVIKKYVAVGDDAVSVQLDSQDDCDVLELNITLSEDATSTASTPSATSSSSPSSIQPSAAAKKRAMERRQAAT